MQEEGLCASGVGKWEGCGGQSGRPGDTPYGMRGPGCVVIHWPVTVALRSGSAAGQHGFLPRPVLLPGIPAASISGGGAVLPQTHAKGVDCAGLWPC